MRQLPLGCHWVQLGVTSAYCGWWACWFMVRLRKTRQSPILKRARVCCECAAYNEHKNDGWQLEWRRRTEGGLPTPATPNCMAARSSDERVTASVRDSPKCKARAPGVLTFLQNLQTERELESNLDLRTTRPSSMSVHSLLPIPPPTAQFSSSGSPTNPHKSGLGSQSSPQALDRP